MATNIAPQRQPVRAAEQYVFAVDTKLYSFGALFRTCYKFTDRCYLFLHREADDVVIVELRPKTRDADLESIKGEFANELIDQRLRAIIRIETETVRDLIVAQAFAETRARTRNAE